MKKRIIFVSQNKIRREKIENKKPFSKNFDKQKCIRKQSKWNKTKEKFRKIPGKFSKARQKSQLINEKDININSLTAGRLKNGLGRIRRASHFSA